MTAEAGSRVGLSAGAKVVHVSSGALDRDGLAALKDARPDVVLLVGGTDGGDSEVLRHNASRLSASGPRVPYVVAGNADARDEVVEELRTPQAHGRRLRERPPAHRRPRPAPGARRDPRRVRAPRHRRQGPHEGSALRAARPRCDARPRAGRRRAARRLRRRRRAARRRRWRDHRRLLRAHARRRGGVAAPRGRRDALARSHGRGRPRDALERHRRRRRRARGEARRARCRHRRARGRGAPCATTTRPGCRSPLPTAAPTRRSRGSPSPSRCGGTHARPTPSTAARPGRDLSAVRVVVASGGVFRHAAPDAAARDARTGAHRPRGRLEAAARSATHGRPALRRRRSRSPRRRPRRGRRRHCCATRSSPSPDRCPSRRGGPVGIVGSTPQPGSSHDRAVRDAAVRRRDPGEARQGRDHHRPRAARGRHRHGHRRHRRVRRVRREPAVGPRHAADARRSRSRRPSRAARPTPCTSRPPAAPAPRATRTSGASSRATSPCRRPTAPR